MTENKDKQTKDLALDIGDVLQLQFLPDESHTRHYVRVIGYMPEKSVLVSTPHINGKVMLVREGQRIAVRTMTGVNIIAFAATVLRSCARPYPYLHLSYPDNLQSVALRNSQRVHFNGVANVRDCSPGAADKTVRQVSIQDMSTSGALLIAGERLGDVAALISLDMMLQIGAYEEKFSTIAIIRNVRERQGDDGRVEYLHGVEFKLADRREAITLHAFVYEQMALSR